MTTNEPLRKRHALLAHTLSNSNTILYGLLDQLQTSKPGAPQLARMASELERAIDQIVEVTNSLRTIDSTSNPKDEGVVRPERD